ncbi:hypothetical protein SDC9_68148 [bioreactor metagenome]|uniref:Uncharacterized protein n=1 Tax=bioreactor metagenome TaxID=1076179 RepID=A0A644Y558_9ZZZZ
MTNDSNRKSNKQFDSGTTRFWSDPTNMPPQSGTYSMSVPPTAESPGTSLTTPQYGLSPAPAQFGSPSVQQPDVSFQQGPPFSTDPGYIPYFLRSNIGKSVRAEFIVGSNQFVDKTGRLLEVGINYFVLEDFISRARVMCDLYSVRFVTIL